MTRRRKRRPDTIRRLAIAFGVHERTLRRWIARPQLRSVLRVYRHGKQWRLDIPKTAVAFAVYKRDVLRAVRPFRRKRRVKTSRWAKETARRFGYGNEQRERDLRVLHLATQIKIATGKATSVFKAKSRLAEETRSDRSSAHVFSARLIAEKYGCKIFDLPKYLDSEEQTRENKNRARRMRQDWPTRAQWDQASAKIESFWRTRTLTEAARKLADLNQPITGANLARRLFLNEYREHAWKANKKQKELLKQHPGESVVLDSYGKRGISLRLFRQRYKLKDIQKARAAAEGTVESEQQDASERDERGYGRRLEIEWSDNDNDNRWHKKVSQEVSSDYLWEKRIEETMRNATSEDERKQLRDYLQQEFLNQK